jgi:hypothetical protein
MISHAVSLPVVSTAALRNGVAGDTCTAAAVIVLSCTRSLHSIYSRRKAFRTVDDHESSFSHSLRTGSPPFQHLHHPASRFSFVLRCISRTREDALE